MSTTTQARPRLATTGRAPLRALARIEAGRMLRSPAPWAGILLWVGANTKDADIQVTLSEVRPDGTEYLVQNGWLRLGHRALDEEASKGLLGYVGSYPDHPSQPPPSAR